MAVVAKTALISGFLVGLGWVSFNVRIEGRTPYGHFRAAGGEQAALEGWAWIRDGVTAGGNAAWAGTKSAATSGVDAVGGWMESAGNAAQAGWAAFRAGDGARPAAPPPRAPAEATAEATAEAERSPRPAAPRVPAIQTDKRARARVERLEQAAKTAALPAAESPAERTRVDRRIAPEEKAALDDKLAARGAQ